MRAPSDPPDPWNAESDPEETISYVRYARIAWSKFRQHFGLLALLVAIFAMAATAVFTWSEPSFTAEATIGPAPSPLDDLLSATSSLGGSIGSSITKRLGLGGRGGSDSTFDEYTALLKSNQLAERIAQDQNLLRAIFPRRYDWNNRSWKQSSGPIADLKHRILRAFHYPVRTQPDAEDVARFLQTEVSVDAPLTSSFVTVTLKSDRPEKADWLLSTILADADAIIREAKRRDAMARIAYLSQIMPSIRQTDQKEALSNLLSNQQQSLMVIHADQRYASELIDPPYSSPYPTSPSAPLLFGIAFLFALGVWSLLVILFGDRLPRWLSIGQPRKTDFVEGTTVLDSRPLWRS